MSSGGNASPFLFTIKTGHSKSVAAYDSGSQTGFFIDHSIPHYPKFNSDNK